MSQNTKANMIIVEDDVAWSETVINKFNKFYNVTHFTNGEECVEKIESIKPKFIILDYHLDGEMTGFDTLKVIKKKLPEAYVIMFSAQDDVSTAVNIMEHGAYDYVVKNENSVNKLKIVFRNIESNELLKEQVINLNLKVKRERFWLGALILGIFIISFIIYLQTCPHARLIKWDPFNVEQTEGCGNDEDKVGETLE